MSFLSNLFGNKYNDEELSSHAHTAIVEDPLVSDPTRIIVTSEKGVVTITGSAQSDREKDHVEGVVRTSIRNTGLKHDRIVNNLQVAQKTA